MEAEFRQDGSADLPAGTPLYAAAQPQQATAQPVARPDGRLHADGYFTWDRRDGYVLDAKLPCDFYLSAQPQQATGEKP